MKNWISVEDYLPGCMDKPVFVANSLTVWDRTAVFSHLDRDIHNPRMRAKFKYADTDNFVDGHVTHWMEKPLPPKEDF